MSKLFLITPTGTITLETGNLRTLVQKCDELKGRKGVRVRAEIQGERTDAMLPERMSAHLTVLELSR